MSLLNLGHILSIGTAMDSSGASFKQAQKRQGFLINTYDVQA